MAPGKFCAFAHDTDVMTWPDKAVQSDYTIYHDVTNSSSSTYHESQEVRRAEEQQKAAADDIASDRVSAGCCQRRAWYRPPSVNIVYMLHEAFNHSGTTPIIGGHVGIQCNDSSRFSEETYSVLCIRARWYDSWLGIFKVFVVNQCRASSTKLI